MEKITPHLWFDRNAEEAVDFYTSLFPSSEVKTTSYYTEEGHDTHGMDAGTVMAIDFKLNCQSFSALNGGPHFKFNPSISFFVQVESIKEVERLWNELIKDGQILMPLDTYSWSDKYGWLQDRFGITWQISLGKKEDTGGQTITPCLMYTREQYGRAQEAINHYTSIFKDSHVQGIYRYGKDEEPDLEGKIKHAQVTLEGQTFMIMESAQDHKFEFNEAISFVVRCKTAKDVDHYWEKLTTGGDPKAQQCGWLKDKFGVSWQVIPVELYEMLKDDDPEKVKRVSAAFMEMKKMDIEKLRETYESVPL